MSEPQLNGAKQCLLHPRRRGCTSHITLGCLVALGHDKAALLAACELILEGHTTAHEFESSTVFALQQPEPYFFWAYSTATPLPRTGPRSHSFAGQPSQPAFMKKVNAMTALLLCIAAVRLGPVSAFLTTYAGHFDTSHDNAVRENCTVEHADYLYGTPLPHHPESLATPLTSCLLNTLSKVSKANCGSAGVLLGILPSILALVGSTTAGMALLGLRRPLLALCLAAGSPAVSPIRTFEYHDPIEALEKRDHSMSVGQLGCMGKVIITLIEYGLALAAVANVLELGLELGYQTVSSWTAHSTWTVLLWTFIALPVHIAGSLSLRLQVRVKAKSLDGLNRVRGRPSSVLTEWFYNEFTPCACQNQHQLASKPESVAFLLTSWFTSTLTVLHITYGTLVLSSLLFISVGDAAPVVARYLASSLICRAVVMLEL